MGRSRTDAGRNRLRLENAAIGLVAGLQDAGLVVGRDVDVIAKSTSDILDYITPPIDSFIEDLTARRRDAGALPDEAHPRRSRGRAAGRRSAAALRPHLTRLSISRAFDPPAVQLERREAQIRRPG